MEFFFIFATSITCFCDLLTIYPYFLKSIWLWYALSSNLELTFCFVSSITASKAFSLSFLRNPWNNNYTPSISFNFIKNIFDLTQGKYLRGSMVKWLHVRLVIQGSLAAWVQTLSGTSRYFLEQETLHWLLSMVGSKNRSESVSIS